MVKPVHTPGRRASPPSPVTGCTLAQSPRGTCSPIAHETNSANRALGSPFVACRAFPKREPNRHKATAERQSLSASHGQRPWFQNVMTKTQMTNHEWDPRGSPIRVSSFGLARRTSASFGLRHSCFFRHSSFVIRDFQASPRRTGRHDSPIES